MNINFIDILLLCNGHQHVLATHMAIFKVNVLENKNRVRIEMFLNRYTVLKHNYWLKLTVE
jgi:hypothetical protein